MVGMGKRKTIDEVKVLFESNDYILLEETYINNKTKMKYRCKKHPEIIQETRTDSLVSRNGGCRFCGYESLKEKTKLDFDIVKKAFVDQGYILLETEYINSKTPMRFECPFHKDKENFIVYSSLQQGHGCGYCGGTKKLNFDEINKVFIDNDFTLIDTEYLGVTAPMKCYCNKHPEHIQYIRVNTLKKGHGCPYCYGNQRLTYDFVKEKFNEIGLELLEDEYVNSQTKMKYNCKKHNDEIQQTTYGEISKGHGCYHCGIEKRSGENAWNYNPNKEDDARLRERQYVEYYEWRRKVYERDKYTCQCCGINSGHGKTVNLNAHHLDNYIEFPDLAIEVSNAITLCENCHKDFHKMYGIKYNTREQFEEYMEGISWNCKGIYKDLVI
jgi:hypothetical protein